MRAPAPAPRPTARAALTRLRSFGTEERARVNRSFFKTEEGSYGHEEQDARMFAGWGIDYLKYIAEHTEPWSYEKFCYFKPVGWKGFADGPDSG